MPPLAPRVRRSLRFLHCLPVVAGCLGLVPRVVAQQTAPPPKPADSESTASPTIELPPFEVRPDKDQGYVAPATASGSRGAGGTADATVQSRLNDVDADHEIRLIRPEGASRLGGGARWPRDTIVGYTSMAWRVAGFDEVGGYALVDLRLRHARADPRPPRDARFQAQREQRPRRGRPRSLARVRRPQHPHLSLPRRARLVRDRHDAFLSAPLPTEGGDVRSVT